MALTSEFQLYQFFAMLNDISDFSSEMKALPSNVNAIGDPVVKAKRICETLRAALPSYDAMVLMFANNGAWWRNYRMKIRAFSGAPAAESIEDFAARVYTTGNPSDLGTLAVAFARSASDGDDLYALVESLVTSEFTYMTTVEGLGCLVLLAKVHKDIGQPRKAWMLWRKAMTFAQGLYQIDAKSPAQRGIWWEIYLGDRMTSMLIGLPYGFNDMHFGDTVANIIKTSPSPMLRLSFSAALLAGKVIDRDVSPNSPSFAYAMDLDEQMIKVATVMPDSWWDVPSEPHDAESDDLRQRLVLQFYFFHVKLYIHLPFIGQSSTEASYHVSRLKSMEAARELLRRYNTFRCEVYGSCLYECRTCDFIAFTAVVVLMICTSRPSEQMGSQNSKEDSDLVTVTEGILEKQEIKGCRIARQSRETIQFLSGREIVTMQSTFRQSNGIRIPYFGTVVKRPLDPKPASAQFPFAQSSGGSSEPIQSSFPPPNDRTLPLSTDPYNIEYWRPETPPLISADSSWGVGNNSNDSMGLWSDSSMLEIDQDWTTLIDFTPS